jgi:TatD DNase family protein
MAFYNVHTHNVHSKEIAIVQSVKYPLERFHSSGIHPWDADLTLIPNLEIQLQNPFCKAMGEVGLDRLKGPSIEIQHSVLLEQISLANRLKKPVIFHIVRAWDEFYTLQKSQQETPWILHGFNQAKQFNRLLETPLFLSIGPAALINPSMHPLLSKIPAERLLFETDDFDVSISEVYQNFSRLTSTPLEDLKHQIEQNFIAIFGT